MKLLLAYAIAASFLLTIATAEDGWSWNAEPEEEKLTGEIEPSPSEALVNIANDTRIDEVVEHIIASGRQGRNLKEYDDIYSDPGVREALESGGDDREARNVIKERLCSLGLMQCDDPEGKRPYIAPEDLVYAQPVDIKPIGQPIPSIAIKSPGRAIYGPPKPVPFPNKGGRPFQGPPPRRYGPPPSKPFYGPPPPKPVHIFEGPEQSRPPFNEAEYVFDHGANANSFFHHKDVKKPVPIPISTDVQQHVHHHFHHNSEADGATKLPTTSGFKPNVFSGTYGGQVIGSVKPVVEQVGPQQFGSTTSALYGSDQSGSTYGTGLGSYGSSSFGSSSFGASVGAFGNSGFYKKELNVGGPQSNSLGGFDKFQVGSASGRTENYDCVCVPYDQCPAQDVIGRKEDLYLALDPRNVNSDIEAEEDRVITDGNGTMTVVRVAKGAELNLTKENATEPPAKKVAKREAEKKDEGGKAEARQNQYNNNKGIKPTFGVSFGLPNQGGFGGYPVNPLGGPLVNPYNTNGGINLGLVSVNPLVSVQVTKDDYGDKVVKPFVNLHVTPNDFLLHKFADFFSYKKHGFYNKYHHHYHAYKPHHPVYFEKPHFSGPPIFESGPPIFERPYYSKPPIFESGPPIFEKPYYSKPPIYDAPYYDDGPYLDGGAFFGRAAPNLTNGNSVLEQYQAQNQYGPPLDSYGNPAQPYNRADRGRSLPIPNPVKFPSSRRRRDLTLQLSQPKVEKRQAFYGNSLQQTCGPRHVCCKRPLRPLVPGARVGQCGVRHSQGINGRIKNPVYVDGDSEFGEYPWQVAILKKDPKESVYVCGGTLIDALHVITAAHCVKTYSPYDLRVRLGEWDVNHDVEFFPYVERDAVQVHVHPEFYAGTLYNDLAVIRMDKPVDLTKYPHISPACIPSPHEDYTGHRCWTTGWGKDAFGDFGKYQNILKEVDVPIVGHADCQQRLQHTRLGYDFKLHPGFICAGGEEGKDACKGDGGGPMVCERGGTWKVVGIVSWGIGCGQNGVPGVYVKVGHYADWIRQLTNRF